MPLTVPIKDMIYVVIQLILFVLFFLPVTGQEDKYSIYYFKLAGFIISTSGSIVLCVSLVQLKINFTPFPSPKKSGTLIQSGLYKFIRHPIYTGILLLALGISMYQGSAWKFAVTVALQILFYFKSEYEEKLLTNKFKKYKDYKLNTGRFFPRLRRSSFHKFGTII